MDNKRIKVVYFVAGAYSYVAYYRREEHTIIIFNLKEGVCRKKISKKYLDKLPETSICASIDLKFTKYNYLDSGGEIIPKLILLSFRLAREYTTYEIIPD